MKCDGATENRRIPLAERLQLVRGERSFPIAIGLRDLDFFYAVGKITGDEEKYRQVYESYIRKYGSTDNARVDVINLIEQADQLTDEVQENLLYWTLVEPFAAIKKSQELQKERKE